jgi:hypothetical protein
VDSFAAGPINVAGGNVKPDPLQRAFYGLSFNTHFADKRGTAFQDWFVKIAGYAYGPDFEEVKPYGSQGDLKCDGLRRSTGAMFQCYAPDRFEDKRTIPKVRADFLGAVQHWPNFLRVWVFLHNDRNGLSPEVTRCFGDLAGQHKSVRLEPWSEVELHGLTLGLDLLQLEDLFGQAPSLPVLDSVGFEQLKPIIDAIQRKEPDLNAKLTPPSEYKIERNKLSSDAAELLRLGRRKEARVQDYINKMVRPDVPERIAEAMREQYRNLKALELTPDETFAHLQRFVGVQSEPRRQAAALAVLCYFFERCDIFEDLPPQSDAI